MVEIAGPDDMHRSRSGLAGQNRKGHLGVFRTIAAHDLDGRLRGFGDCQIGGGQAGLQVDLPEVFQLRDGRTTFFPDAWPLIAGKGSSSLLRVMVRCANCRLARVGALTSRPCLAELAIQIPARS